jgi:hypothetical protein
MVTHLILLDPELVGRVLRGILGPAEGEDGPRLRHLRVRRLRLPATAHPCLEETVA